MEAMTKRKTRCNNCTNIEMSDTKRSSIRKQRESKDTTTVHNNISNNYSQWPDTKDAIEDHTPHIPLNVVLGISGIHPWNYQRTFGDYSLQSIAKIDYLGYTFGPSNVGPYVCSIQPRRHRHRWGWHHAPWPSWRVDERWRWYDRRDRCSLRPIHILE